MAENFKTTPPPPRQCISPGCSRQAFTDHPYCDDCSNEVRHWAPEVWAARVAEFQRNKR